MYADIDDSINHFENDYDSTVNDDENAISNSDKDIAVFNIINWDAYSNQLELNGEVITV